MDELRSKGVIASSEDDSIEDGGLSIINIAKEATLANVKNQKITLMNNNVRFVTKTFILYPRENPESKNVGFILIPSSLSNDDKKKPENILFKTGPEYIETIQNIRLVSYTNPYTFDLKFVLLSEDKQEHKVTIPKNNEHNDISFMIFNQHQFSKESSIKADDNSGGEQIRIQNSREPETDSSLSPTIEPINDSRLNDNMSEPNQTNASFVSKSSTHNSSSSRAPNPVDTPRTIVPQTPRSGISSWTEPPPILYQVPEGAKNSSSGVESARSQRSGGLLSDNGSRNPHISLNRPSPRDTDIGSISLENTQSIDFNSNVYTNPHIAILNKMHGLSYDDHIIGAIEDINDKYKRKNPPAPVTNQDASSEAIDPSAIVGDGPSLILKRMGSVSSSPLLMIRTGKEIEINDDTISDFFVDFELLHEDDLIYDVSKELLKKLKGNFRKRMPNEKKFFLVHKSVTTKAKEILKKSLDNIHEGRFIPNKIRYIANTTFDPAIKEEMKVLNYSYTTDKKSVSYLASPRNVISFTLLIEVIYSKNNASSVKSNLASLLVEKDDTQKIIIDEEDEYSSLNL